MNRRGITLIEMVAVMAVTGLITAMGISMIFSVLQQESTLETELMLATSQQRLAEQFRADVEAAQRCELEPEGVKLFGVNQTVRYTLDANFIQREQTDESRKRRDSYVLRLGRRATFSTQPLENRTLVRLATMKDVANVTAPNPYRPVRAAPLSVVAELDREHRYVTGGSPP